MPAPDKQNKHTVQRVRSTRQLMHAGAAWGTHVIMEKTRKQNLVESEEQRDLAQ